VIPFKKAEFLVWFFAESGNNVVWRWFQSCKNPDMDWIAFQALLDIYKAGGYNSIRYSTIDLGDGFYGLKVQRRGEAVCCPIFTLGPTDSENEITFLVGARWDEVKKRIRPYGAVGMAEENLELLRDDRTRRLRG
jgi:hypothetical protein